MYSKCLLNDTTYYAYKKLEGLKLYTSNRIAKEFTDKLYSNEYDYAYVDMIEKDYTHFMNLNMQILSTQFLLVIITIVTICIHAHMHNNYCG